MVTIIADNMNEIRPLTGGTAASTVNGKNAALNQFNTMQRLRDQPEFSSLSEDKLCSVKLFQIFAGFIIETATAGREKDELLMRDTCIQYVSELNKLAVTGTRSGQLSVCGTIS